MAYALVRSTVTPNLAVGVSPVYGGTPTAGNLLLCSVCNQTTATQPTVSDSNGNWTLLASVTASSRFLGLFGLIVVASQPTTITIAAGTDNVLGNIYEFSGNLRTLTGIVAPNVLKSSNGATNTASTAVSNTAGFAGSLVFSQLMVLSGGITAIDYVNDTPAFTLGLSGPATTRLSDYYYLASSIGDTYGGNFTWTTTRVWIQLNTELVNKRPGIMF